MGKIHIKMVVIELRVNLNSSNWSIELRVILNFWSLLFIFYVMNMYFLYNKVLFTMYWSGSYSMREIT